MLNSKMPVQAQMNSMVLRPKFSELDGLCLMELMLISQIAPLMFIVAKLRGPQHGLKG